MSKFIRLNILLICALVAGIAAIGRLNADGANGKKQDLIGRIVAVGVPGVSAISPVGAFLPGGPIHDNPAFAAYTQPGRILDPGRILVGSRSNFGAALTNPGEPEGSFLSIDPRGAAILEIPSDFAAAGGQASTLDGRVQMFSANSPTFYNGVSNPLGLSINNAFGRLWPANAPTGIDGIGTSTILDPSGIPLAGAPNPQAGGVFAGDLTPRLPSQVFPGALGRGAVGTAFLGRSPDGSGRAGFCVALADGSVIQAHTGKAVDGIAPVGTVSPLFNGRWDDEDDDNRGVQPRLGVILNYTPTRILYVSEPSRNTIAAIDLIDDGVIFRVGAVRRIHSEAFNEPIDLAPAEIETEAPNWASNTTLEEGADFYVANRRDNTIVRMRQDGTVVAVRRVRLSGGRSLGNGRLNGIAVSPDGSKIWVTVTGHLAGQGDLSDAVLELPPALSQMRRREIENDR